MFLFLFFLLLSGNEVAHCQAYQKGWESFTNNKNTEARTYFNQAVSNSDSKEDALLSLCLIDWYESKLDDAFDDFANSMK